MWDWWWWYQIVHILLVHLGAAWCWRKPTISFLNFQLFLKRTSCIETCSHTSYLNKTNTLIPRSLSVCHQIVRSKSQFCLSLNSHYVNNYFSVTLANFSVLLLILCKSLSRGLCHCITIIWSSVTLTELWVPWDQSLHSFIPSFIQYLLNTILNMPYTVLGAE